MFERTEKITACSKCIINNQRQVVFACKGSNFFKIRNIESWITNGFQIDGLGIFINMLLQNFQDHRHLQNGLQCRVFSVLL